MSAAGVFIGSDVRMLLAQVKPISTTKLSDCLRHDFGSVSVWSKGNMIDQIGVFDGYQGALHGRIRVGSTIADMEEVFGAQVEEDEEDKLIVPGSPGWCFETESWSENQIVAENRHARITEICVFLVRDED